MSDRMITLATYSYSRAQLLKARLESEGVECYLKNINLIQSAIGGGVKLRIKEEDLSRSLRIIEELDLSYTQEDLQDQFPQPKLDVNRILVPIDFSDVSPKLCEAATDIAKKFNADILLFHTYFVATIETVPFSDSYTYNSTVVEILSDVEKNAEAKILELSKTIKKQLEEEKIEGIEVDVEIAGGTATSEILNICKKYQPDLIVMGSRGETAGTSNLLGSVVSNVIEETDVPILLLSDEGEKVDLEKIDNIMYATDFSKHDFRSIANLKYITNPYQMKIHCVHFEERGHTDPIDEHKMQILRKFIKRAFKNAEISCRIIQEDDKINGIEKYISDHSIGMVAILARKHNLLQRLFIGEMSRKLFIRTHAPILIFH